MDGADELAADRSRSNMLGDMPVRLAVMWQSSRKTEHGWEVRIQAAGIDPAFGAGNVIAIVSLGGHGGISSTRADVEATAAEMVRCYNDVGAANDAVRELERQRDDLRRQHVWMHAAWHGDPGLDLAGYTERLYPGQGEHLFPSVAKPPC
jgi:hypothetical protein